MDRRSTLGTLRTVVFEFVTGGPTDRKIKRPTIKKQNDILDELWEEKWEELRQTLEQKGWISQHRRLHLSSNTKD